MSEWVIPESSLPVNGERIYHLSVAPSEIADNVLIVGDPERVPIIANNYFKTILVDRSHRGLRTITGLTENGVKITATTSGMGTPSLEIVLNELIALRELDIQKRAVLPARPKPLNIIRIGTSGSINVKTPIGTSIIPKYSIGLDNTGHFYDIPAPDAATEEIERRVTKSLQEASTKGARFASRLAPYVSKAHPAAVEALVNAAKELNVPYKTGITTSAGGFFCNQGRRLLPSIGITVPDVDNVVGTTDFSGIEGTDGDIQAENMEMESSFLFHLCTALGYRCGAICLTIAQRREGTFLQNQAPMMEKTIATAVRALENMDKLNN